MTTSRPSPYIHVGWLKKLLVGDDSCQWASWFKAHHKDYEKTPNDFILAVWKMEHTSMLTQLRTELLAQGSIVKTEAQNQFYLRGSNGITVSGTPDLVAFGPNGEATIYDTKTGRPNQSDIAQVMIYMWALPYAIPEYKDKQFNGVVVYADNRVAIPASAINEKFKRNIADLVRAVGAGTEAIRIPSERECSFCELTNADCSERVEQARSSRDESGAF